MQEGLKSKILKSSMRLLAAHRLLKSKILNALDCFPKRNHGNPKGYNNAFFTKKKHACLCFAQDQGQSPCMVTRRVTIMVSRRVTINIFALDCFPKADSNLRFEKSSMRLFAAHRKQCFLFKKSIWVIMH